MKDNIYKSLQRKSDQDKPKPGITIIEPSKVETMFSKWVALSVRERVDIVQAILTGRFAELSIEGMSDQALECYKALNASFNTSAKFEELDADKKGGLFDSVTIDIKAQRKEDD